MSNRSIVTNTSTSKKNLVNLDFNYLDLIYLTLRLPNSLDFSESIEQILDGKVASGCSQINIIQHNKNFTYISI